MSHKLAILITKKSLTDEELEGKLTAAEHLANTNLLRGPDYAGARMSAVWLPYERRDLWAKDLFDEIQAKFDFEHAELLLERLVRNLILAGRGAGLADSIPVARLIAEKVTKSWADGALDVLSFAAHEACERELEAAGVL